MKRILSGACALALVLAAAVTTAATPASAGGFGSTFLGTFAGTAAANIITRPRVEYRYGYQQPPVIYQQSPPVVYQQGPVYAYPGWCGASQDSYGNYCNVSACAAACGGSFKSFRLNDCSYIRRSGWPRERCGY